ncbi:MAG: DUF3990 domain-containing protein, partial [Bacteroidales bacterium]|nr:DUF3990 domain-containing protein [Bacteroidales bacterium]
LEGGAKITTFFHLCKGQGIFPFPCRKKIHFAASVLSQKVAFLIGTYCAEKGFVSQYEFTEDNDFKMIVFDSANSAWVDFVHSNRSIPDFNHDYDIVKGPVANDNVYLSFNLYESGIISKAELIARLKTYKLVDQFLFHTPQSLSTIKFVGYKEVKI